VSANLHKLLQVLSSVTIKLHNVDVSVPFRKFRLPNAMLFNIQVGDTGLISSAFWNSDKCPANPKQPAVSDMLSVLGG
jgi:hypothetical protein